MTREQVEGWLGERGEDDVLLADGFDAAFIGVVHRCGEPAVAVYDYEKCVAVLVDRDGMDEEEAVEFFEFNVVGSWVGPGTPAFVEKVQES